MEEDRSVLLHIYSQFTLQILLHDAQVVAPAVENGHDIDPTLGPFVPVEQQIVLVRQKTEAAALQHPVLRECAGFRELRQDRRLLLQLPDKADGKLPAAGPFCKICLLYTSPSPRDRG